MLGARVHVRLSAATLAIALLVPAGSACSSATEPGASRASLASLATDTRVLAISVDGLNPSAIRKLGRSGAPSFYRLYDEGAATFNARTELEQTVTLSNHTSMMTGRRIERRQGGHGVTWDDDRPGTTVQGAAGHGVASIFTKVRGAGGSTALFSTKPKFALFDRSWPQGIDRYEDNENQRALARTARRDLVDANRDFTFLHVSLPDRAGHASGFMSPAYIDAVRRTDRMLGRLLQAIDNHAALADNLVVVLTADHGGRGEGHSDRRKLANYRVPFMVWGPGVTADSLYALNPDYDNPGRSRPDYTGRQPVRNGDLANLSADLLGLDAVAGSELNAKQDLDVHSP